MNPKAFMISITGNEISEYYRDICVPTWEEHGYTVEQFEASTPSNFLEDDQLKFTDKKFHGGKWSDTEFAVWYSHYRIWKKCVELDEPILVLEHDTYRIGELPSFEGKDIEFFCKTIFRKGKSTKYPDGTLTPAAGYYLMPKSAAMFVSNALRVTHNQNVDGFILLTANKLGLVEDVRLRTENINSKYYNDYYHGVICCVQYVDDCIGTTIEHARSKLSKRNKKKDTGQ